MNEAQGFEFLDLLNILSFIMQVISYQELMSQASTDDIFKALQKIDREYLNTIVSNQEKIMAKLAELSAD